jgi:hypothetical protein
MGQPVDCAAMWMPELGLAEDTAHGQRLTAGMQGRVFLAQADGMTICANGTLKVRLYNNGPPLLGEDSSQAIEEWTLQSSVLQQFAKKDAVGWGYNVWLPTSRLTPAISRVRMSVEFDDEGGHRILAKSQEFRLKYDDKTSRILETQSRDYAQWQQQNVAKLGAQQGQAPAPQQQNQNSAPNGYMAQGQMPVQYQQQTAAQMPVQPYQQPVQQQAQMPLPQYQQQPQLPLPQYQQPQSPLPQYPQQAQMPLPQYQQQPQMPMQYQQPAQPQQQSSGQYPTGTLVPAQYQNAQPLPQPVAPPANLGAQQSMQAPNQLAPLPAQALPASYNGPQLYPIGQIPPPGQ